MKRHIIKLAVIGTVLVSAAGYAQMGMMNGRSMMDTSAVRHRYVARHGIDAKYAEKRNPLQATAANVKAGKELYGQNCAVCHGPGGRGDGPAGKNLNPPPTNIAASKMPMTTDAYLYWTIAEGGAPLGTSMPPFKGTLKEDQIWKIIVFLREL